MVGGTVTLTVDGDESTGSRPGGYAYLSVDTRWTLRNESDAGATFHWIRKAYERVDGDRRTRGVRDPRVRRRERADARHRGRGGAPSGSSTRDDVRHDMHVNIVTLRTRRRDPVPGDPRHGARPLRPGGQGGLPAQQATGSRCRRATSCGCARSAPRPATPVGPGRFRYLLYKDVNRHAASRPTLPLMP